MTVLLLCLIIGQSGCTSSRPTIRAIWDQVPTVRWTGRLLESETRAGDSNSVSEPAVAANVAVKVDAEADRSIAKKSSVEGRPSRSVSADERPRSDLFDLDSSESQVTSESDQEKSLFDLTSESDRTDSAMERLNSALMGDSLQKQALPEHSLTSLDERVEVESLLSQAKQLLDSNQLDQALEAAKKAQEIGDHAHLEYSPDEERPSDLISRIQGHREAIRLQIEPKSEDFAGPPAISDDASQDGTTGDPKKTADSKDGHRLSRIRRDLSTLFRREKKGSQPPELESATPIRKPPQSAPDDRLKPPQQQAARENGSPRRDAIVMANRSVSLGPPEDSVSSATDMERDELDEFPSASKLSIASAIVEMDEDSDEPMTRSSDSSSRTTFSPEGSMNSDGVTSMPTELQAMESDSAFQDMSSTRNSRARSDEPEQHEPLRDGDWTIYYFVFGLFSLYAVRCYRRGAT